MNEATVAVVGATGAVGNEMLRILAERRHPLERIVACASDRSVGASVPYGSLELDLVAPEAESLAHADLVLLAVGAEDARRFVPSLAGCDQRIVDNSSAFRMDPAVPLIVPEVNGERLSSSDRLVANPNCSAILLLVALEPLRRAFGLERVVVATYQAVSGAGREAVAELEEQTRAVVNGAVSDPQVFPVPCAFNVFPHESEEDAETGWNGEERKISAEARRVWELPKLEIVPTCARVPVLRSHSQAVTVTLQVAATVAAVREALGNASGVTLTPFPTALDATGRNDVLVGRVRPTDDPRTFCLWLAGDQLRKGAALNALQIGNLLLDSRR